MKFFCFIFLIVISNPTKVNAFYSDSLYECAYKTISNMLAEGKELSFKKAVFVSENAYKNGKISYKSFEENIKSLTSLAKDWIQANPCSDYKYEDSINLYKNISLFKIIKDTIKLSLSREHSINILPFGYNFEDFLGKKEWQNIFVTTMLATRKGNCHSLPYLYKILADELGATCWLSFVPYHIYIKNRCLGVGWYNTELTSGQFPVDGWIMASSYVSIDAVRSGIYMDTLSNEQAIANCALDLAKGYERKYKNYTDSFIIKCCDLTLKYHPININAIIYKAESLKKMYLFYQKHNSTLAKVIYSDMEKLYIQALDLGYKEMPENMYREWLLSVSRQKNKYSNKKLSNMYK